MHAEFIDALGGVEPVAEHCGIKHLQAVHNWKRRGIPWRWRPAIAKLAKRKRVPLPAEFFGESVA